MKNYFSLLFLFCFSLSAHAAEIVAEIVIDKAACRYVQKHQPHADVAYQEGVDVNGNAVAPADLVSPQQFDLEKQIRIKLTNDAANVFGIGVPEMQQNGETVRLADPELEIGYITLEEGRAYLNGKPLDSAGQGQLAVLCNEEK